jgi:hypothetical protein
MREWTCVLEVGGRDREVGGLEEGVRHLCKSQEPATVSLKSVWFY